MRRFAPLLLCLSACGGGGGGGTAATPTDDPLLHLSWEEYTRRQEGGTPRFETARPDPIRVSYFKFIPVKDGRAGTDRYVILAAKGYTAEHGEGGREAFARGYTPLIGSYVPDERMRQLVDDLLKLGVRDLPDVDPSRIDLKDLQGANFKAMVLTIAAPEFQKTVMIGEADVRNNKRAWETALNISKLIEECAYGYAVKVVTQVDRVVPDK